MTKRIYILAHQVARAGAIKAVQDAPDGYVVRVEPPSKSRDQECHYHAIFGEAAEKCRHLNRAFDLETWKRLLVDQFIREMLADPTCDERIRHDLEGESSKMIPSLDGSGIVQVGYQTRHFGKRTASAFIEWLKAWMAENTEDLA